MDNFSGLGSTLSAQNVAGKNQFTTYLNKILVVASYPHSQFKIKF